MNAAVFMQTCPSEETLAAFLEGRLDGKARLEIIEHLAGCGECRDIVMAADEYRSTLAEVEPAALVTTAQLVAPGRPVAPGQRTQTGEVVRGRFGWRVVAPLAAAASVVALFWMSPMRQWIIGTSGMADLVAAADQLAERPTAARLSGDFAYRRNRKMRGDGESRDTDALLVEVAAANSRERAEKNPTPENLHERGVADILTKRRNDAVPVLERAAKESPASADILTDLAAAYIARGAEGDYQRAHDAATKAWSIEQTPAAAWNIALSLEYQAKIAEAIAAWQRYLAVDPGSEWSAEAERHLADLKSR